MSDKKKDDRIWKIKNRAEYDNALPRQTRLFFGHLVDYIIRTKQWWKPFIVSWRTVQHVAGGSRRVYCIIRCYWIIRQLETAGYIGRTPRRHVDSFSLD